MGYTTQLPQLGLEQSAKKKGTPREPQRHRKKNEDNREILQTRARVETIDIKGDGLDVFVGGFSTLVIFVRERGKKEGNIKPSPCDRS